MRIFLKLCLMTVMVKKSNCMLFRISYHLFNSFVANLELKNTQQVYLT